MLKELSVRQARFIALLADTARTQRDSLLAHVAETDLGGAKIARGEHNPTAELGFDPQPPRAALTTALREAIATLSETARQELYTLMRIGQGDLAANRWYRGLSDAELLGDGTITAAITEDSDLHDHITKAGETIVREPISQTASMISILGSDASCGAAACRGRRIGE